MAFLFRRAKQPEAPAPLSTPDPTPAPSSTPDPAPAAVPETPPAAAPAAPVAEPPSAHAPLPEPEADRLIKPALSAYISEDKASGNASAGSDQVVQKGTLVTVAKSIRHCVSGMSPWDISDLTLGLYKIATRHALEGVSDSIEGSPVSNKQELEEILYWLDWSWASYLANEKAIVEFMKIKEHQLKKHVNTSSILKPAYCIAVDDAKKSVVLSIRGTYAATDVLTDLQPHSEKFEGGYAHSGILSAARWILSNENDTLQVLLSENPGYKLILAGHSLGAGAACLLTYLLRESVGSRNKRISSRLGISNSMIECWGYGCPPCVDKELCENAPFIKNIVLQDDIVARASIAALEDLRSEILLTDWADVLEDGGVAKKMLGLVNTTNSALGNVERALGYESGTFFQQAKSFGFAAMRAGLFRGRPGPSGFGGPPGPGGQFFGLGHHGPPGQYGPAMHHGPSGYYGSPWQYGSSGYQNGPNQIFSGGSPHNGMQGPRPQNAAGWISHGASAISSYLKTSGNTDQTQESSSIVASSRDFMEGGRLFVPGILFHVKRMAPEGSGSLALALSSGPPGLATETNGSSSSGDLVAASSRRVNGENSSRSNSEAGTAPAPMRFTIIKASDPKSRFSKIVLSKTLLSDHSLVAYKDCIKEAVNAVQEE